MAPGTRQQHRRRWRKVRWVSGAWTDDSEDERATAASRRQGGQGGRGGRGEGGVRPTRSEASDEEEEKQGPLPCSGARCRVSARASGMRGSSEEECSANEEVLRRSNEKKGGGGWKGKCVPGRSRWRCPWGRQV